ncbi:hypothetical protein, partial [Faecalicatena contorta]|uniref:hypothetical protein n=1 Tax=Faecalicatena contorta TaxID=39482 RepID=UPI003217986D
DDVGAGTGRIAYVRENEPQRIIGRRIGHEKRKKIHFINDYFELSHLYLYAAHADGIAEQL